MNLVRKILFILVVCVFFQISLYVPLYANATDEENIEHHFVIVYDISKSMDEVDSENNIQDKIAVFLENIPENSYPAKVLILPFAGSCPAVGIMQPSKDVMWWEIDEYHDKEIPAIKKALGELKYTENYTDIEQALQTCQNELLKMREGAENCQQVVLFMTDGLPDLAGNGEEKFKLLYESYSNILSIAKSFPDDVAFLGIVPDVKNLKDDLKYNQEHTRITEYYGKPVPEQYGEQMLQVSQCMQKFCDILGERQKYYKYPAKLIEIDWQSKEFDNIIKNAYKDFYKMVFEANVTEKTQQNLEKGVSFRVPETVSEIDINIDLNTTEYKNKEEIIQKCLQNIYITRDNGEVRKPYISNTRNSVIVKLVNPSSGTYTMHCQGITDADLQFYAYGSLHISSYTIPNEGIVGEEICLSGKILNKLEQTFSDSEWQYINLLASSEEYESIIIPCFDNGDWEIRFTPQKVGTYSVKLTVEYDDTTMKDNPCGVSCFYSVELFNIIIKESEDSSSSSSMEESTVSSAEMNFESSVTDVTDGDSSSHYYELTEKSIYKKYALYIVCGFFLFVIVLIIVIISSKRNSRHVFTIYMPDNRIIKITVKSSTVYEYTKIRGLKIQFDASNNTGKYRYNENGPFQINSDEIHLK